VANVPRILALFQETRYATVESPVALLLPVLGHVIYARLALVTSLGRLVSETNRNWTHESIEKEEKRKSGSTWISVKLIARRIG
jgi:hypothetical protein